jgi:hypothetical protein
VPKTLTPAPTDRAMWRRLMARCHPDQGGTDDLFVWVRELQQHVAGDDVVPPRRENVPQRRTTTADSPRLDYTDAFNKAESFAELTAQAVALADTLEEPYGSALKLLEDCHELAEVAGIMYRQQHQGASYRSLAAIGHKVGMDKQARSYWYRIAEAIPLSQRHAGHILSKLQDEAA